jgi:glucan 1,3-beta-glucosidase
VSDLEFFGGKIGFRAGSQQFTARNLQFYNCGVAISMIWDWGFTWKHIVVNNCYVAIDCTLFGAGPDAQGTGSIMLLDSQFINVPYAIPVNPNFLPSLTIDNLQITNDPWVCSSECFVVFVSGSTNYLQVATGAVTVPSWAMGLTYGTDGTGHYSTNFLPLTPSKPPLLLDSANGGIIFERSKPQYETLSASSFLVATANGISNDATGDQSGAINSLLAAHVGTPIFFPAGVYLVENTVNVPVGSVLVGEGW